MDLFSFHKHHCWKLQIKAGLWLHLCILDTCWAFLLMCNSEEGILIIHPAHSTPQTRANIYYHKQQNIASKIRLLSILTTPWWHLVLFNSRKCFLICLLKLTAVLLYLHDLQSCSSEPPSPQSLKRSHWSCIGIQRRLLQVNSVFPQGRGLPATTSTSTHTIKYTHTCSSDHK